MQPYVLNAHTVKKENRKAVHQMSIFKGAGC